MEPMSNGDNDKQWFSLGGEKQANNCDIWVWGLRFVLVVLMVLFGWFF